MAFKTNITKEERLQWEKEKKEVIKKLSDIGEEMDSQYKLAWAHLIAAYKIVGWKSVFYLVLKFQKHVNSKYQLQEKQSK